MYMSFLQDDNRITKSVPNAAKRDLTDKMTDTPNKRKPLYEAFFYSVTNSISEARSLNLLEE